VLSKTIFLSRSLALGRMDISQSLPLASELGKNPGLLLLSSIDVARKATIKESL